MTRRDLLRSSAASSVAIKPAAAEEPRYFIAANEEEAIKLYQAGEGYLSMDTAIARLKGMRASSNLLDDKLHIVRVEPPKPAHPAVHYIDCPSTALDKWGRTRQCEFNLGHTGEHKEFDWCFIFVWTDENPVAVRT